MDIVDIKGFRAVTRMAIVAAAMTALSGAAWAQFSSGPSGSGPHTGTSAGPPAPSEMSPSGIGQGAAPTCGPNTAVCGGSTGSSGNAAPSSDENGQSVNDLQVKTRNDKVPSRRTDD